MDLIASVPYRQRGQEQRRLVHRMWHEGASAKEIAEAAGVGVGSIHGMVKYMRADGWDMPYRRSLRKPNRFRCPRCGETVERQRDSQKHCPSCALVLGRAHEAVRTALRKGTLIRPDSCDRCGGSNPDGHHPDYDKPLEVEWLCRSCHTIRHAEERATPWI